MRLTISLVLHTEKEKSALAVVSRLNKLISAGPPVLEKYHKVGTKVHLQKELPETSWPDAYLAGLNLAQTFGNAWTVVGCADEELRLVGNKFSVTGIEWAEVWLTR